MLYNNYNSLEELFEQDPSCTEIRISKQYSDRKHYTIKLKDLLVFQQLERISTDNIDTVLWPEVMQELNKIKRISIFNAINFILPEDIHLLESLEHIKINSRGLQRIPSTIFGLANLKHFEVQDAAVVEYPQEIKSDSLRNFRLFIGRKQGLHLDFNCANLRRIACTAVDNLNLACPELVELSLQKPFCEAIHIQQPKLQKLYITYVYQMTSCTVDAPNLEVLYVDGVKEVTCNSSSIKDLRLDFFRGTVLPDFVMENKEVQKLYLEGATIESLPENFSELTQLEELYIHESKLKTWPTSFFAPQLKILKTEGAELEKQAWPTYAALWPNLNSLKSRTSDKVYKIKSQSIDIAKLYGQGIITEDQALAWQALVAGNKKEQKCYLTKASLLQAAYSSVKDVQKAAYTMVDEQYQKAALSKESRIYTLGRFTTYFQAEEDMQQQGLQQTSSLEEATHILLAEEVDTHDLNTFIADHKEVEQTVMSINAFNQAIGSLQAQSVQDEYDEQGVLALLSSEDKESISLGLQLMHNFRGSALLLAKLYCIARTNKDLREEILLLMHRVGSPKMVKFLEQDVFFFSAHFPRTCKQVNTQLKKVAKAGFDALAVALFFAEEKINTHSYVFEHGTLEQQRQLAECFVVEHEFEEGKQRGIHIDIALSTLPKVLLEMQDIQTVNIINLEAKELGDLNAYWSTVQSLSLEECALKSIKGVEQLTSLQSLIIDKCPIHNNLEELDYPLFKNLKTLTFKRVKFKALPIELSLCPELENLYIEDSNLECLAKGFGEIKTLKNVSLKDNHKLKSLSTDLYKSSNIKTLYLENSKLFKDFPEGIAVLTRLQRLHVERTAIVELPQDLVELKELRALGLLSNSKKPLYPRTLSIFENLEELALSAQGARKLPEDLSSLSKLYKLKLRDVINLKCLPTQLEQLQGLEELCISTYSASNNLPNFIRELKGLKKLTLQGLKGVTQFVDLSALTALEYLTVRARSSKDLLLDEKQLPKRTLKEICFVQYPLQANNQQILQNLEQKGIKLSYH